MKKMRLIIGISGASGVVMGYRMLQVLEQIPEVEVHLVITEGAIENFKRETNLPLEEVSRLADYLHSNKNMAASISSGSFHTDGMIVIPASMKTIGCMANGIAANLLLRAADVCLKENRKIVLVPREMPLSRIHLKNLQALADYGCTIVPPMLTFYNEANTVTKQIDHIIGKVLMQFGISFENFVPWKGDERDAAV